jgi:hypothetical protein
MSKLAIVLIVVGFIILTAVTGWLVWSVMRPNRSADVWPELATQLGLVHTPFEVSTALDPGTISGTYDKFVVTITAKEQYRRNALMVLTVSFHESLNMGLEMANNVFLRDQGITGLQPFSTGEKDFDKAFQPQAQNPEAARRLFEQSEVRDRIVDLMARGMRTGIYDDRLVHVTNGLISDVDKMREILDLAVAAARAIEKANR